MASPDDYWKRVSTALGIKDARHASHLQWKWDTATEAKQHLARIRQLQKELRLIKKDVGLAIKQVHASYATEKAKVGKTAGSVVFGGLFGKKTLGSTNASIKDGLRRRELNAIAPYQAVARTIDEALFRLDEAKLQIDAWMIKQQ